MTCFCSQEHVPYIYHKNKDWTVAISIIILLWLFTKAVTGKGRLETHYYFLNILFNSFIEDGHDIITEEDIFKAFKYRGGMAITEVMLLNASTLNGLIVQNKL